MRNRFYPTDYFTSTYVIDFEKLYKMGYRGVIFDVDNTLVEHDAPADDRAKEFISNDENRADYPEKHAEDVVFEDGGVEHVLPSGRQQNITSKHVISLQTDRGTSYNTYFEVSNELYAAYDELRDDLARKEYGKPYNKLEDTQQMLCRLYYKTMISEAEPRSIGGGI